MSRPDYREQLIDAVLDRGSIFLAFWFLVKEGKIWLNVCARLISRGKEEVEAGTSWLLSSLD